MRIETERLIIRDFSASDANDLHEILGDDETMKNCEPAYDFEKTRNFLAEFCIAKRGAFAAEKSARLMEKLGMKREGVQRSQAKDCFGNWTDLYLYGKLRSDI